LQGNKVRFCWIGKKGKLIFLKKKHKVIANHSAVYEDLKHSIMLLPLREINVDLFTNWGPMIKIDIVL